MINKINLDGKDYSIQSNNIKVVEIKGTVEDETIRFEQDVFIDFSKNIRFEIYMNSSLCGGYVAYTDIQGNGVLMFSDLKTGERYDVDEIKLDGMLFYFNNVEFIMNSNFWLMWTEENFKNIFQITELTDNVTMKLYYIEADELTTFCHIEL